MEKFEARGLEERDKNYLEVRGWDGAAPGLGWGREGKGRETSAGVGGSPSARCVSPWRDIALGCDIRGVLRCCLYLHPGMGKGGGRMPQGRGHCPRDRLAQ